MQTKMDPAEVLAEISKQIDALADRERHGEKVTGERAALESERHAAMKNVRGPSRFVNEHASDAELAAVAAGSHIKTVGRRGGQDKSLAGALTKALSVGTGSAGGVILPVEVAAEIVTLIRARSAIMRMGPTSVQIGKELDLPAISTGSAAFYVAENAPIPVSEQTFSSSVLLRPKELGALVPVSNQLLRSASTNPALEDVIRSDMAEVLALRQDLAFIQGTGGTEPLGLINQTGLTAGPSLGANGRAPTFDDLKAVPASLRAVNAVFTRPGWVFNPRLLDTIERIKDSAGNYLGDSNNLLSFDATGGGGTLLGFPFVTTTQIPVNQTAGTSTDTSYIIFSSDWQEAWVGWNQELTMEVSGDASYQDAGAVWHSAYQERQQLFRANLAHDFALRRPSRFVVMRGVRP